MCRKNKGHLVREFAKMCLDYLSQLGGNFKKNRIKEITL